MVILLKVLLLRTFFISFISLILMCYTSYLLFQISPFWIFHPMKFKYFVHFVSLRYLINLTNCGFSGNIFPLSICGHFKIYLTYSFNTWFNTLVTFQQTYSYLDGNAIQPISVDAKLKAVHADEPVRGRDNAGHQRHL